MTRSLIVYGCLVAMFPCIVPASASGLQPRELTCEYRVDPYGIDTRSPRLSWTLTSAEKGDRQTGYRLLVASSSDVLSRDRGDLFDSGKVRSGRSNQVEYAGAPLRSGMACWWKVRVWDRRGQASPWSRTASWSEALLNPADWKAHWISFTPPAQPFESQTGISLEGAHWIWYPEGDPHVMVPAETRTVVRDLNLPADAVITAAAGIVTADDQFVLLVNGKEVAKSDGQGYAWQRPVTVDMKPYLQPGDNTIRIQGSNAAASPAGVIGRFSITLGDGRKIDLVTDGSWQASLPETPVGTDVSPAHSRPAMDLGAYGAQPWGQVGTSRSDWAQTSPSPVFRKEFPIVGPVRRAVLYICGLGYNEAWLNGRRVGNRVLDPAFTRYDKRCLYSAHDVTSSVRIGSNAIGVMLGNGFYNQHARDAWNFDRAPWRGPPALLLQLVVTYASGATETVVSDATWKADSGPVARDGIRNGEIYDARLERPGWDAPGFDDSAWNSAEVVRGPRGALKAETAPPVRVMGAITPVRVTQPDKDIYVFDMGQAFAGWAQLRVAGPAGTKVTLRYGERLDDRGRLTQAQIASLVYQGPFQTDTYILRGGGPETWEPSFTYHGFRYVEVTGYPGTPTLQSLQGEVIHTAFRPAGEFTCSNELLNTIQKLTLWSYRSNFVGIPTDCPHREKNGWTGDAQLAAEQAMYNWDNTAGYEQWLNDFDDCQHADGDLPGIVPTGDWGYGTGPSWDSAYLLIPWYLYRYQGDVRVLQQHYAGMKRYVDYLTRRARKGIVDYGLGDWVPYHAETPAAVTSTAYYYVDCQILSDAATVLGHRGDAARYAATARSVRRAFQRAFVHGGGSVANSSQTALSCALYQGLAPAEDVDAIVDRLVKSIHERDDHLDVGILGAKYLFHVLSDHGSAELAYRVATQTTEPGYGNWVARGATTLWEDWRGQNSLDHVMFGDISGWFYQTLAGINLDPSDAAFRKIVIRPHPVRSLEWVHAWHNSPYGRVVSGWRRIGDRLKLEVEIPPGCSAAVYLPTSDPGIVTVDGHAPTRGGMVELLGYRDGTALYTVESGTYVFESRYRL